MNRKEEEIKRKLLELETSVLKETTPTLITDQKTGSLRTTSSGSTVDTKSTGAPTTVKSDLCYFGGLGLIGIGILMLFQYIQVGNGVMAMFGLGGGGGGFGLLLVPLLVGIGWMFYDSKNRAGWYITGLSCAVIFFAMLSSIRIMLPSLSLLSMVMMLSPFAIGGALLIKGLGGPKGVEESLRSEIKQLKKEKEN
jgi:hypothetical protein